MLSETAWQGLDPLYNDLFGDFPYQTVSVATIGDNASVAIGAQALILVPEDLWYVPVGDPFLDTVKEVMTHELAHQYFFNLIGITGPADAWLSEGFAEYAATRASEHRNGTTQHSLRNYWAYIDAPSEGDEPLYSVEVRESPIAFEVIYQKGSALLNMMSRKLGRNALIWRCAIFATLCGRDCDRIHVALFGIIPK